MATGYNNLGSAWYSKGKYDQAIVYFERSQAIWDRFFEPTHPNQKIIAQNLSKAANGKGMELSGEKKYQEALKYFQKALQNAERAQDDLFSLTCLNNAGSMQKQLEQYEEGLQSLDAGLQKAARIDEAITQAIKEQFTPDMLEEPEVQNQIAELRNPALIRRLQYHKVGCLKGLNRNKEADALARQLWLEGRKANDTRLLEDLKKDGYNFGP